MDSNLNIHQRWTMNGERGRVDQRGKFREILFQYAENMNARGSRRWRVKSNTIIMWESSFRSVR